MSKKSTKNIEFMHINPTNIARIKGAIRSNTSLLIVVLGALSSFLLVLFLKKFLPHFFNAYSLYLTYIGIIVSFGFAGFDQVFLRLSVVEDKMVRIGRDVFLHILLCLLVIPLVISYYFHVNFHDLPFILLFISGVSLNAVLLAYNILRLKQKFVLSQLFNSGYKILFLLGIFLIYFFPPNTITGILLLSSIILCFIGILAALFVIKNLLLISDKTDSLNNYFFSFSLNLALLTLLTYGERIVIANELGEDVFGMYFYYSTVFLFPLTLIQYYVGFKELVYFKEGVAKKIVHQKVKKVFLAGLCLIAFIFFIVILDQGLFLEIDIKENSMFIFLLSVLGIVKLNYGLFSALLGAKGEFKDIYKVNFLTAILVAGSVFLLFTYKMNIELIIVSLIVIFLSRIVFIYRKYVY